MKSYHTLSIRYDYRLKFYNMKQNINMNTLTNTEKEGIWVPSLVFSNTEEKVNTVNDPKAFAVVRFVDHCDNGVQVPSLDYDKSQQILKGSLNMSFGFFRRDSDYGYSDDTVAENIYIFEVFTRPSEVI